ncbi:hypothetical protein [Helicobacter didelphidarum]|uniref:hypothetical protein n=1 Tax=Helicobacter didelphidarum TaxID=2040648 RepID=UPI0015F19DAC|nr:hypothetical protein [Helicobacter didelphidarum]
MVLFLVILWNIIIPLTLSYFIWWLIYRKAFKSQKKISKFLVFIGSIAILSSFYIFNIPYYFQPSYYKFKKMCKLNELPNNEEKYNKILGYYGLSLDTLDWEKIGKKKPLTQSTLEFYYINFRDKDFYAQNTPLYSYYAPIQQHKFEDDTIEIWFKGQANRESIDEIALDLVRQTYLVDGMAWDFATSGDFNISLKKQYCFPQTKYRKFHD